MKKSVVIIRCILMVAFEYFMSFNSNYIFHIKIVPRNS